MDSTASKIIGIAISLYLLAAMMPSALVNLAGANLTGVDDSVVLLLQVLVPTIALIAIVMAFFRD